MDMETELRGTCHFARVNDVIFPAGCSDLFITCSVADIRVWNAVLRQELLRIQVPYGLPACLPASPSPCSCLQAWGWRDTAGSRTNAGIQASSGNYVQLLLVQQQ